MPTESNRTPRKPPAPVRTINGGRPEVDVVTDEDYQHAIDAQDATLFAQGLERKILGQIRTRLVMGARDGGTRYYLDTKRGIVRRREAPAKPKRIGPKRERGQRGRTKENAG